MDLLNLGKYQKRLNLGGNMNLMPMQCFKNDDPEHFIAVYFDQLTPAGKVHDFLMNVKGHVVQRMIEGHQEHMMQAQAIKALEQQQEQPKEECQPCAEVSCTPA